MSRRISGDCRLPMKRCARCIVAASLAAACGTANRLFPSTPSSLTKKRRSGTCTRRSSIGGPRPKSTRIKLASFPTTGKFGHIARLRLRRTSPFVLDVFLADDLLHYEMRRTAFESAKVLEYVAVRHTDPVSLYAYARSRYALYRPGLSSIAFFKSGIASAYFPCSLKVNPRLWYALAKLASRRTTFV